MIRVRLIHVLILISAVFSFLFLFFFPVLGFISFQGLVWTCFFVDLVHCFS